MATIPLTSIIFSVIVFMLLSNAFTTQASGAGGGKPKATSLVVEACKNASDASEDPGITQEFCLSTLQSDNRSAEAKDLPGLVLVSTDIFKGRVTDAGINVKKMLQNAKKGMVAMYYALRICEVKYENVVSTLNICQAMIRDYQGVKGDLQSLHQLPHCLDVTSSTVQECEAELEDKQGAEAMLSANDELRILVNLNIALVAAYAATE